jgi:hypothetical protein
LLPNIKWTGSKAFRKNTFFLVVFPIGSFDGRGSFISSSLFLRFGVKQAAGLTVTRRFFCRGKKKPATDFVGTALVILKT